MKKILGLLLVTTGLLATGCAPGQTNASRIGSGQWTPPSDLGTGKNLIQGYSTQDALNGAKSACAQIGRSAVVDQIIPSTQRERATVTYSCK